MIKITALIDNKPGGNRSMTYTHSLSFYIEANGTSLLFDFGSGSEFLQNADRLGISPMDVEYTLCSHSHYDHAAGYKELLKAGITCPFITGKNFFDEKYAVGYNSHGSAVPGKYSYLGCGFSESDLKRHKITHLICDDIMKIAPGIFAAGNFPRKYDFETIPAKFVKWTGSRMVPDTFEDEVVLVLDHPQGLIVLTGCSHPGILNILSAVQERFSSPIQAVIGGIHLSKAEDKRLDQTMSLLKRQDIRFLALNHCSGDKVSQWLERDGEMEWCYLGSGDCLIFP